MRGKWRCHGNRLGLLKHKVSMIFGLSHSYGGKFRPFEHPCSGFGHSVMEYWGGQASLSVLFYVLRRGISSSRCVSMSSESGGGSMNSSSDDNTNPYDKRGLDISPAEAKRLLRLVNVEALKEKLGMEGKEVIWYSELLEACQSMGVARNKDEAATFARILDEACVVLLFRDKVYLHPEKVVDLVRSIVPPALIVDDNPMREELKKLREKKEEIDVLAHRQVRRMLWSGLVLSLAQVGLFFRLTFWEFSWDVMEPVAFFTTTTGVVIGYAYFMFSSRDPTYQDLMKTLFMSRQKKLLKKYNFDIERFKELQRRCRMPCDARTSIKNRVGVHLDSEDSLSRD